MRRYEHDFFKTRKLRICDIAEKIMRRFVKMSPHYTRLCSHVCAFCAKCAVEKSSVCAMTAHLKNHISMRLRAVRLNWRFEVQLKQPKKSIRGAVTSAFCDVVSIADSAVFSLGKHWINRGTHLACIFFVILHENFLKYIKYSCVIFMQSDEKSVCAICKPDLFSASLIS